MSVINNLVDAINTIITTPELVNYQVDNSQMQVQFSSLDPANYVNVWQAIASKIEDKDADEIATPDFAVNYIISVIA